MNTKYRKSTEGVSLRHALDVSRGRATGSHVGVINLVLSIVHTNCQIIIYACIKIIIFYGSKIILFNYIPKRL